MTEAIIRFFKTWAIATRDVEFDGSPRDGLIGQYWFSHNHPDYGSGMRTATWRRRTEARAALLEVRRTYPKAAVIRLLINMWEVKP